MQRRWALVFWMLTLASCTPQFSALMLPDTPGAQSMILVVEGDETEVFGFDLKAPLPTTSLVLESDSSASLYAFIYERSLAEMGWSAGRLSLAPSRELGSRLPFTFEVLEASLDEDGTGAWVPVDPPDRITSLRVVADLQCTNFEVRSVLLPGTRADDAFLGVALDGNAVLAASESGRFYRVTPEGAEYLPDIPRDTPHLAAFRSDDGRVWLLGEGGRFAVGTPETGFSALPPTVNRAGRRYLRLTGSTDSSPLELFAVSDGGSFERYDGQGWTRLDGPPDWFPSFVSGVVWIGPNEAAGTGADPDRILWWRSGQLIQRGLGTSNRPAGLGWMPDLQLVAGDSAGRVFALARAGQRTELTDVPLYSYVTLIVQPYGRGFIAGGGFGVLFEYLPGRGFCPGFVASSRHIGRLFLAGDYLVAVTNRGRDLGPFNEIQLPAGESPNAEIVFLRPTAR